MGMQDVQARKKEENVGEPFNMKDNKSFYHN